MTLQKPSQGLRTTFIAIAHLLVVACSTDSDRGGNSTLVGTEIGGNVSSTEQGGTAGASEGGSGGSNSYWGGAAGSSAVGGSSVTTTVTSPNLLAALKPLCEKAGGTFTDYECHCPAGEPSSSTGTNARAFSTDSGGQCQEVVLSSSTCMTNGFSSVLKTNGSSALKACLRGNLLRVGGTGFQIASNYPAEVEADLAAWLDDWVRAGKLLVQLPSQPGNGQTVVVQFGFPASAEVPGLIDTVPYPMPGAAPLSVVLSRAVYAKNVADLPMVLGATSGASLPSVEGRSESLTRLVSAINVASFGNAPQYKEQPLSKECQGACEVTAEFPFEAGEQTLLVQRTRRYHGGTVYAEWLTLTSENGRKLLGWVDFDLGGNPNFLATLSYTENPFETIVTSYDYNLTQLDETTFDVKKVVDFETLDAFLAESSPTLASNDSTVVVCESNIGVALNTAFAAALLRGPHHCPMGDDGCSAFGWLQAASNDVDGYLDSVVTAHYSLPISDSFYAEHAAEVTGLALGSGGDGTTKSGLRLLPLSAETCVYEPSVFDEIAKQPGSEKIRVVSLSATLPSDHAACVQRYPSGVNAHYLWVMASGNAGRTFTDLDSSFNCPQSVAKRDNVLVVDGADGDQVMESADRGRLFSDIAASCRNEDGNCAGTSLAAPRVSNTAALVVQKHGSAISNQMVRAAILLSATIPSVPFNNRSGGILNATDALRFADTIVAHGYGDKTALNVAEATALLEAFYSTDSALVATKLATLEANGFFQ